MSKSNSDDPKFVADIPTQPNLSEILNIPKLVEGIHSQARENLNQVQSALPFFNPLGFVSNDYLTDLVGSVDGLMDRAVDRMSDRIALRTKEAIDEEVQMRNNEIQMSKQRTQQQIQDLHRLKILEGVDAIISNSAIGGRVTKATRKKRRPPSIKPVKPLTDVETNTLTAVTKHGGNIAAAAKDLDRDPKTVRENYNRGMTKLNIKKSRSVDTVRMLRDPRERPDDN